MIILVNLNTHKVSTMNLRDNYKAVNHRLNQLIVLVCIFQLLTISITHDYIFNIVSAIALIAIVSRVLNPVLFYTSKTAYLALFQRIQMLSDAMMEMVYVSVTGIKANQPQK